MRCTAVLLSLILVFAVSAAEVESRVLTHYLPQDFLETAVRTEKWTEVPLAVKGGVRKDDVVRIWAGGLIDRGNHAKPGLHVNGPEGMPVSTGPDGPLALTANPDMAYALLFKTETSGVKKCFAAGKPLEIKLAKDGERLWIGFNDERGQYLDNHLGKGRRHELDPLWVRIEVVRIIVDYGSARYPDSSSWDLQRRGRLSIASVATRLFLPTMLWVPERRHLFRERQ